MTSGETDVTSPIVLGSRLGGGFFGEVYKGEQAPHGPVAIKVIDCNQMMSELNISDWPTLRDRLQREAESLRKAESAHIVRVFGVGATPDRSALHIVTELCEGSLLSLCEHGPISTVRVRRAVSDALHGLEALHARGMIHRDLKPGNLLYVGNTTKLADFGLVSDELVHGYASLNGYTEHLAPEVHLLRQTSTRTDVWAMGLTIYRLVNGEPWYREEKKRLGFVQSDGKTNLSEVIRSVTEGGFGSKLRWMPHVHDAWRRFVRHAMHDKTDERFDDGGAMLTHFTRSVGALCGPDWTISYMPTTVRWTAPADNARRYVVEWDRSKGRRHTAWARSEGLDGSRPRTFMTQVDVAPSQAVRHLEDFFKGRVST